MPISRARVLLAEDNDAVAAQIQELLAEFFDVIGVVSTGEALEAAVADCAPDVVVTDVAMPGEGGLQAVRHIHASRPQTPIVLLSVHDAAAIVRLGFAAGAHGYVVKENAADELVPAVAAALRGQPYISATARDAIG